MTENQLDDLEFIFEIVGGLCLLLLILDCIF